MRGGPVGCRAFALLDCCVAPLVFRAPEARPRAVRAASFARRVVSKPGQAPPPPTGTAAGPSGALHTGGTCGSGVPRQAPPPPTGTAAGPLGALHTGGACGSGVLGQAPPPSEFRMQFPRMCFMV